MKRIEEESLNPFCPRKNATCREGYKKIQHFVLLAKSVKKYPIELTIAPVLTISDEIL